MMTFKIFLNKISIFFLFIPGITIAQDNKLKIGLQVGYSLTDIIYANLPDKFPEYSSTNGYTAGLNFTCFGKRKFGFAIEPGYIQKGAGLYDTDLKLSYINLPIFIKYKIHKLFDVGIGLETAFLMQATINTKYLSYAPANQSTNQKNDITDDYFRTDLSAIAGIDFNVYKKLDLFIHYSYGLKAIEKLTISNISGTNMKQGKLYNTAFIVGIRFNFIN